ncbi:hypothetical protein N7G274_009661 [Stereocaulon virgatum]|uniref:Uncharacterized protein n=1 Tax=Stereocaulon virgatum TaxID=373712 RepID=A0ABR3ZYD1_9LECA
MRLSFVIPLLVTLNVCLISGLQLPRSISASAIHVSNILSLSSHHNNYIDHKFRKSTYLSLNHGSYHQRNVKPFPIHSVTAVTATPIVASTPPTLLDESANISTSRHSSLINVLPMMKAAEIGISSEEDWSSLVDVACSKALTLSEGHASNPSSVSLCYNVRTFESVKGTFEAELRLYRIAAPRGDWMRLNGKGIEVGVEFNQALVTMIGRRSGKRGIATVEMPLVERDEARDMWRRRAGGVAPMMLQDISLTGFIDGNLTVDGISEDTMRAILTPDITLSGITQDGTAINTELALEDASFVTGLFIKSRVTTETATLSQLAAVGFKADFVLPGTIMVGFPTGLVITSVWSLLLLAVEGYGIWKKLRARNGYRRRVKERLSGGRNSIYRR